MSRCANRLPRDYPRTLLHRCHRTVVNLDRLQTFFSTSPSAKLMRSPHAAHIVCFLYQHFKASERIVSPNSSLVQQLSEFLDQVHQTEPDMLKDRAETYVATWSTGDSRWMRRFLDAAHTEPVYELTPHTEDVLKFLDEVLERNFGFVGTESRLKRIVDTLSDIVVRGSADPARRLDYLRAERERIEREIASIEAGDEPVIYSSTAIRERFADALSDLASLQGDFRAVEESFKAITRNVQKQQAEREGSRGEILGFALDAEDNLKSQDQGISFDEFVRLVLSPRKQDELETIVQRLHEIEALAEQVEGMRRLRGMMGNLSDEAEKVLGTTRRLSATLRRLLDTRVTASRLRLAGILREIRAAAVRLAECAPKDSCMVNIFAELDLCNAFERTFWTAPAQFETQALSEHEPDEDDLLATFRRFAELRRLDWTGMRSRIAEMLRDEDRVPLAELLAVHPPESGAVEVLGYVQIAHDDGHLIDPGQIDVLRLPGSAAACEQDNACVYEAPHVVFLNHRLRAFVGDTGYGETTR
jgi:hypothetical protein